MILSNVVGRREFIGTAYANVETKRGSRQGALKWALPNHAIVFAERRQAKQSLKIYQNKSLANLQ